MADDCPWSGEDIEGMAKAMKRGARFEEAAQGLDLAIPLAQEGVLRRRVNDFMSGRPRESGGGMVVVSVPVAPDPAEVHAEGRRLYEEVKSTLWVHYYFEQEWAYSIAALFVLQAWLCLSLPAVFYLFVGGRFESGKTNVLSLLGQLTDGLMAENISVAALARSMEHGRTVVLDEIDVPRGKEYDEIRDALLRQGYKSNAAPYRRWDAKARAMEVVPIYGPKLCSFRGALEDALQSRGLIIPSAKPLGEASYEYILRNFWPRFGDLPDRLQAWGKVAVAAYPADRMEALVSTEAFKSKVRAAVNEMGANRESELGTIACLVAEMAGVDVAADLRAASEIRRVAIAQAGNEGLEELEETVLALAQEQLSQPELDSQGSKLVRLLQKDIKQRLDQGRRARGEKPLEDRVLARLRRELGVKDVWLKRPRNRIRWDLPATWLEELGQPEGEANPKANPKANLGSQQAEDGPDVSHVSRLAGGNLSALDQAEELRRLREATTGREFGSTDLSQDLRRVFAKYLPFLLKSGHLWQPSLSVDRYKWLEGGGGR